MILLANKPIHISSNAFATKLGKKHKVKFGFSGTLDPFASGALLLACKKHAKLFRFLNTAPKVYEACIWLGASSKSLDNENINLCETKIIDIAKIQKAFAKLQGEISYTPPDFCAKKINGIRAYELARSGKKVELAQTSMQVKAKFLHYKHPFIAFRLTASKGTYVRSYAQLICEELGQIGTLSSLRRISEGDFKNFGFYDAFSSVNLDENYFLGDLEQIECGKKLKIKDFKIAKEGLYKVDFGKFFSIFELKNNEVKYILNKVEK